MCNGHGGRTQKPFEKIAPSKIPWTPIPAPTTFRSSLEWWWWCCVVVKKERYVEYGAWS